MSSTPTPSNVIAITGGMSVSADAGNQIDLVEKAKFIRITNSIKYIQACEEKLAIDEMIRGRHAVHDPAVEKAFESHKAACRARASDIDPLTEAKRLYTVATDRWRRDQVAIAIEAARAEREEAARVAESQREAEIVEAENAGASVVEVQAIVDRPVYVAPALVRPAAMNSFVPKVAGIRKRPDNWKARLDPANPAAIQTLINFVSTNPQFAGLLQLNESSANALAKGLKTTMAIPGLVVFNDNGL